MIFTEINETIKTPKYDIIIKNLEISEYHWISINNIKTIMTKINDIFEVNHNVEKQLLLFLVSIIKPLPRVQDYFIYNDKKNNLILFLYTDIKKVRKSVPFTKEIKFISKNYSFTIIELDKNDIFGLEKKEIQMPNKFMLNEPLTKRLHMLVDLGE